MSPIILKPEFRWRDQTINQLTTEQLHDAKAHIQRTLAIMVRAAAGINELIMEYKFPPYLSDNLVKFRDLIDAEISRRGTE